MQDSDTTLRDFPADTCGILKPKSNLGNALFGTLAVLMEWQRRASERAHLRELESHYLKDAGLSPGDRNREVQKPFWKC